MKVGISPTWSALVRDSHGFFALSRYMGIWDIYGIYLHMLPFSMPCHFAALGVLGRLHVSTARLWPSSRSSVRLSSVSATDSPTSLGLPLPYGEGEGHMGMIRISTVSTWDILHAYQSKYCKITVYPWVYCTSDTSFGESDVHTYLRGSI